MTTIHFLSAWPWRKMASSRNLWRKNKYSSFLDIIQTTARVGNETLRIPVLVGRSIWKCGWQKTHDPPPPFGTKMTDPPLKQGWKLIHCYTQYQNHRNHTFVKRQMWKTELFLFRRTLWVLTQINSKTTVYWNCLSQSIWKFLQRQPIPTHYLPAMLRLILKENFFHFNGKHYLQNHGTAINGHKLRQQFWFLCKYFHDIYWNNNSRQNCL